ncbi:hypothetical protein [Demequina sp.]|uniref:hypothetical protein n=1 Tax=Demequina sp. TaxID=2050685 RepID=UPI0025D3BF4C|nr:hypothetical protein [Demequina sp.]
MQIYRPRSSYVWGYIAIGVGAIVALLPLLGGGFDQARGTFAVGAAVAAFGTASFLRPHVAVTDERVEMHNILTTATVPFARLSALDTRWTLEAIGDDGRKAGAFAAPAPGAAQSHRIQKDIAKTGTDVSVEGGAAPLRPGDRVGTPSGDAAAMVRDRWRAWQQAHPDGPTGGEESSVTRGLDPIGIALILLGTAAAVWGLLG